MSKVVNAEGNPSELPPLHVAVKEGNCKIVKTLLENGANPDSSPEEYSPLHWAILSDYRDIVELLLQYGANAVGITADKCPLMTAVFGKNSDIVELLLQYGADKNRISEPVGPLYCAVARGQGNIVRLLLENDRNVVKDLHHLLFCLQEAIEGGHCDIVELLLQYGARIKNVLCYLNLLFDAAVGGHVQIIKVLQSYVCGLNVFKNLKFSQNKGDSEEPFQLVQQVFQHLLGNCFCDPGQDTQETQTFESDYLIKAPPPGNFLDLVKITAVNFCPYSENIMWNLPDSDWATLQSECMSEVAQMQKVTVCDANLTLFDILAKDTHQVAPYLRNNDIAEVLNSKSLNDRFPKHAGILKCQFRKGKQRLLAIEEGLKVCHSVSSLFKKLPLEVNELILNYLSLEELLILTNGYPHTN